MSDIRDEVLEFVKSPSLDELSDIAFGVGRLIGSLLGRPYVAIPGDARHVEKIKARMAEYGCVRSRRHLVNGSCPASLPHDHDLHGESDASDTVMNDEA